MARSRKPNEPKIDSTSAGADLTLVAPAPRARARAVEDTRVTALLKAGREQQGVVGPLVEYLLSLGWELEQIRFGRKEWRVPKAPSEATKREKGHSFEGFPCDIGIFDSPKRVGDPHHLLAIIETKNPDEESGVSQLEHYLAAEPHAKIGVWANTADPSASAVFVYRQRNGSLTRSRRLLSDVPRPGEAITPTRRRVTFDDLSVPSAKALRRAIEEILDKVVARDASVTRREEQLDQLCGVLLLKLHSDKHAKLNPSAPPLFRLLESVARTAEEIRREYRRFVAVYPDTFTEDKDRTLRLSDSTIYQCVERLAPYRLIDVGIETISLGFQVLRTAALKQGEGQYFTPHPVVEAAVRLMNIDLHDLVIDPACGTGGFLVGVLLEMQRRYNGNDVEISRWAQTHLFGIDKDSIGVKLTKAIMQIAGDGSAHCVRGDSVRTFQWGREYPHLAQPAFGNGRFSVVLTNPPFGADLTVDATDARLAGLDIARVAGGGEYVDLEIGLHFLQRSHQLLRVGGRLGIVLPETYFFSRSYTWLFDWLRTRFRPLVVANVPMEAFMGFCRAKTNFYIFEKIGE